METYLPAELIADSAEKSLSPFACGICVRTEFCIYRGRNSYRATYKRDSEATWKVVVSSPCDGSGHEKALMAWIDKFTGSESAGFNAEYKVVARGGDHNGCYWILVPIYFV